MCGHDPEKRLMCQHGGEGEEEAPSPPCRAEYSLAGITFLSHCRLWVGQHGRTGTIHHFVAHALGIHQMMHLAQRHIIAIEHAAQLDEGAQSRRLQVSGQHVRLVEHLRLALVLGENRMRLGLQHGRKKLPDLAVALLGLVDRLLSIH